MGTEPKMRTDVFFHAQLSEPVDLFCGLVAVTTYRDFVLIVS